MLSEYVDFREALNEVQKLYACALYKCESNNRDCVEKLTLEYKVYQKNLEKRYLTIPDLSEPDDQSYTSQFATAKRPITATKEM